MTGIPSVTDDNGVRPFLTRSTDLRSDLLTGASVISGSFGAVSPFPSLIPS